jgi:hypothetical protein
MEQRIEVGRGDAFESKIMFGMARTHAVADRANGGG